jgi:hypothetical protein
MIVFVGLQVKSVAVRFLSIDLDIGVADTGFGACIGFSGGGAPAARTLGTGLVSCCGDHVHGFAGA